ncbi:PAS domain S-box protein [soil metagenome]
MQFARPRDDEDSTLAALRALEVLDSAPEAEFDALVQAASLACGTPIALISLIDVERQWFKANVGLPGVAETPRDISFCSHAVLEDTLFDVPDATQDPRFFDNPIVTGGPLVKFYAGAPLTVGDGHRIGTLCIIDHAPVHLTDTQRDILRALAKAAGHALEGRKAAQQLSRVTIENEERLRHLYERTPTMMYSTDAQDRIVAVSDLWLERLGYTREAVIGRPSVDFMTEASRQYVVEFGRPALRARGRLSGVTFQVVHHDGHVLDVTMAGTVEYDEHGSPLRALVVLEDVTLRRKAETALVAERAQLAKSRDLLDRTGQIAGIGGWEFDLLSNEIVWSAECRRIHGVAADFVPSLEDGLNFYPPEARAAVRSAVQAGIESGEPWDLELPFVRADGRRIWVRTVGTADYRDGRPVRLSGAFQDITERKRLGLQLAQALESSRDLYDNAPCGFYSIGADGRFMFVNATALEWFGCSRDELIGQRREIIMPPEGLEQFRSNFEKLKTEGRVDGIEFALTSRRTGQLRRVSLSATAVTDDDGKFLMTRTVMFDITELHRTREQLMRLNREQLAMLDNELIGILKVKDRMAVWSNRGMERLFGYDSHEWAGMPTRQIYPDDETFERVGRDSRAATADGGMYRGQFQMRHKDGSMLWTDCSAIALPDEPGAVMVLLADLTAIKEAEEIRFKTLALRGQNVQLLEAGKLKDQFLTNMSHELRTPLNAVIGLSQLLQTGVVKPDSPKYATYISQIGTNGRHLLQLIESMLDFTKTQANQLTFRPEAVYPADAIRDVIEMLQVKCQRHHVTITSTVSQDVGVVQVDPRRLRQVLFNLMDNAVKFCNEGGRVEVRVLPEGVMNFRIEVEDDGIGIAESDLPRLFTQFEQLSSGNTKTHEGTGMGLALSRRVIEAHGGKVGVRSAPGTGSVFHLTLPKLRLGPELSRTAA